MNVKVQDTVKPSVIRDFMSEIIDYENGDLSEDQMIDLFQRLVDTGLAWQLQGSYGRTANALLQQGLITQNGETDAQHDARINEAYRTAGDDDTTADLESKKAFAE